MTFLNYHHLLYFWSVAKHGGIARASVELGVAPPTISTQIKSLETALGEDLFHRRGRQLVLTEAGHTAFNYADEIFSLGQEMVSAMSRRPLNQPMRLSVGVAESVPKLVVHALLTPVIRGDETVHLTCHEGKLGTLMADLATYRLDVVISDEPAPSEVKVKAFNHLLGECGITIVAAPDLAASLAPTSPPRSTVRRLCCRPAARRCGDSSTATSTRPVCAPGSPPSSTTPPCSRSSAPTAWASSPCPIASSSEIRRPTASKRSDA